MAVASENEINKHPVLNIYMDATDSTEYITNCVGSMNIHILLVKILLTFLFQKKPHEQRAEPSGHHVHDGGKYTLNVKAPPREEVMSALAPAMSYL